MWNIYPSIDICSCCTETMKVTSRYTFLSKIAIMQKLWKSDMAERRNIPDIYLGYICTMASTVEIWPILVKYRNLPLGQLRVTYVQIKHEGIRRYNQDKTINRQRDSLTDKQTDDGFFYYSCILLQRVSYKGGSPCYWGLQGHYSLSKLKRWWLKFY